jgi:protein-tyrosine-phosphatase
VARQLGVDLEKHRARRVSLEELEESAAIVCMEPYHAAIIEPMALPLGVEPNRIIVLDVPDPYGLGVSAYQQSFSLIMEALQQGGESDSES